MTYRCDSKLKLLGSKVRVCQDDGQWSGREPECYGEILFVAYQINQRAVQYKILQHTNSKEIMSGLLKPAVWGCVFVFSL